MGRLEHLTIKFVMYSVICTRSIKDLCFIHYFQVRRGSLLSQPQSVLQKLASISDGNPLAPRNSRGFLFQTLSPEKDNSPSDAPKKQVRQRKIKRRCRSSDTGRLLTVQLCAVITQQLNVLEHQTQKRNYHIRKKHKEQ